MTEPTSQPDWAAPHGAVPDQPPPPAPAPGWGPAYGAPGYGEPGYGPPHYGPPAYGGAPGPAYGGPLPYGAPAYGGPPPPKPGPVPLRPLGLGEILDGAVQLMRGNPRVMLGFSAIVMALAGLLTIGFELIGFSPLIASGDRATSQVDAFAAVGSPVAALLGGVVQGIATTVLSGVLIVAVSEAVLGRRPTVEHVWSRARPRVWALLGLTLLTAAAAILGLVVLVLPGILTLQASTPLGAIGIVLGSLVWLGLLAFAYVKVNFAAPALLLEGQRVVGSLRRSWHLVTGSWWRCAGILLVSALIVGVANGLLQTPFTVVGFAVASALGLESSKLASGALIVLSNVGGIVAAAVTAPFSASVTALLYIDLRMRREGLDVELVRAATTGAAPGGAPSGGAAS